LRGLWRTRRAAGHDVVDLVRVDRLELEQRLGHRLDLVAIVLEQLARDRVLLVDDLADLASTLRIVSSDMLTVRVIERPRKTSPSFSP
jgi:hypothetical protein